jgi:hypothetical protein
LEIEKNGKFSKIKIPDVIVWGNKGGGGNNDYTVRHEMLQSVDISTG